MVAPRKAFHTLLAQWEEAQHTQVPPASASVSMASRKDSHRPANSSKNAILPSGGGEKRKISNPMQRLSSFTGTMNPFSKENFLRRRRQTEGVNIPSVDASNQGNVNPNLQDDDSESNVPLLSPRPSKNNMENLTPVPKSNGKISALPRSSTHSFLPTPRQHITSGKYQKLDTSHSRYSRPPSRIPSPISPGKLAMTPKPVIAAYQGNTRRSLPRSTTQPVLRERLDANVTPRQKGRGGISSVDPEFGRTATPITARKIPLQTRAVPGPPWEGSSARQQHFSFTSKSSPQTELINWNGNGKVSLANKNMSSTIDGGRTTQDSLVDDSPHRNEQIQPQGINSELKRELTSMPALAPQHHRITSQNTSTNQRFERENSTSSIRDKAIYLFNRGSSRSQIPQRGLMRPLSPPASLISGGSTDDVSKKVDESSAKVSGPAKQITEPALPYYWNMDSEERLVLQRRQNGADDTEASLTDPNKIYAPMHPMEWLGRFSTRCDTLLNQKLDQEIASGPALFDSDELDRQKLDRQLKALKYLDSLCATFEAQQSLRSFQSKLAHSERNPKLMPPVPPQVEPPTTNPKIRAQVKEIARKEAERMKNEKAKEKGNKSFLGKLGGWSRRDSRE